MERDKVSTRDDSGPAFPEQWTNDGDLNCWAPDGQLVPPGYTVHMRGMTLRDYFAGQALANLNLQAHVSRPGADQLARSAYEIADAMLEARNK